MPGRETASRLQSGSRQRLQASAAVHRRRRDWARSRDSASSSPVQASDELGGWPSTVTGPSSMIMASEYDGGRSSGASACPCTRPDVLSLRYRPLGSAGSGMSDNDAAASSTSAVRAPAPLEPRLPSAPLAEGENENVGMLDLRSNELPNELPPLLRKRGQEKLQSQSLAHFTQTTNKKSEPTKPEAAPTRSHTPFQ